MKAAYIKTLSDWLLQFVSEFPTSSYSDISVKPEHTDADFWIHSDFRFQRVSLYSIVISVRSKNVNIFYYLLGEKKVSGEILVMLHHGEWETK